MQGLEYCSDLFSRMSRQTARAMGHPLSFVLSLATVVIWALLGPHFHYSDTWQLVINTSTTIITFLMVFVIQATQNRESAAVQIKLNEIIRAMDGAHNTLLDVEEVTDTELEEARVNYLALARQAKRRVERGEDDTCAAEVDSSSNGRSRTKEPKAELDGPASAAKD